MYTDTFFPNLSIDLLNELLKNVMGHNINISILNKIGEGGFGEVFTGIYNEQVIVLKIIHLKKTNDNNYRIKKNKIQEEINIHRNLNHPNIIRSFNNTSFSYENYEYFVIFMYKAINRDLSTFCKFMKKNIFKITNNTENFKFIYYNSEVSILFIIIQLIKGIFCIHEHNIIHSDLKPQNILIFNNFNIKITDFSISTSISKFKNTLLHIGTIKYSSLECFNGITLSCNASKVDFYSLGIILLELILKKSLNYKKEDYMSLEIQKEQLLKNVTDCLGEVNQLNNLLGNYYSEELIKFMKGLLNPDPNKRLGYKEISNSKWIYNNYKVMTNIWIINVYENGLKLFIELQKNIKAVKIKNNYRRKFFIN